MKKAKKLNSFGSKKLRKDQFLFNFQCEWDNYTLDSFPKVCEEFERHETFRVKISIKKKQSHKNHPVLMSTQLNLEIATVFAGSYHFNYQITHEMENP